jgi:RNA polymerase sigma-70 factor, ECF subfamily
LDNYLDQDLESLKSGDIRAFERLFRHYYPLLVAFAIRYVNDREAAREIVQDFFVKLFERRQSLIIETSVKSYLYRSVHNYCINHINQKAIHDRHIRNLELDREVTEDPDSAIRNSELQQRIHDVVEQLPSKCRKIFRMNRYEGLKNEEIAEALNLSKRTVETQISKALRILRAKLSASVFAAFIFSIVLAELWI